MTQNDDPNRPQRSPLPLDYENAPRESAALRAGKILLKATVVLLVLVAVLIGVVAGACMCMR